MIYILIAILCGLLAGLLLWCCVRVSAVSRDALDADFTELPAREHGRGRYLDTAV